MTTKKTVSTKSRKTKSNSSHSARQEQNEASLREYQAILAMAEEVAQIGSWKWDLRTQKVTWSDEMFRLFGVEREGFDGDVNRIVAERVHPEDAAAVMESNRKVLEEAKPIPLSYRIVLPDGTERTVWAQGKLILDEAGQPQALTGFVQDITERVRAEKQIVQMKRLYGTLSQVNQMIVRVKEREELYETICDVAIKFGEFSLAWVGLLDENTGDVRPASAHGMDVKEWPLPIINIHSGPLSGGLVSQALHTSSVLTSRSVSSDNHRQILPEPFNKHEFHSSAVVPFRLRNKTIGVLCLIAREKGLFEEEAEIHLLNEMSLDISFALDNMENEKERKQAEDALRLNEENFSKAFRSSPAALLVTRLKDGTFLEVNEAYCAIVGFSQDELIGHKTTEFNIFIDPGDRQKIVDALMSSGSIRDFETNIRHRSGEIRSVLAAQEMITLNGEACIITHLLDITHRKQAEQTLRESEERLRLSLQAANQGLYDLNVQTGDAIVNRQYAEMLGYEFETFVETNAFWIERLHPDDQEITAKAYRDYINGLLPEYRVEFRQRTRDGNWKWILSLGKVVEYDPQGNPLRMLGTHTDITERKQTEEKLQRSQETYQKLFESNPHPMWVYDLETLAFLMVNDAAMKHYGYSREEFLRMTIKDIRPKEDLPALLMNLAQSPQTLERSTGWRHRKKDGTLIDVEITSHAIQFEGRAARLVLANDITEHKRAEEALRASEDFRRLIVDTEPECVKLIAPDGKLIEMNAAGLAMIEADSLEQVKGASVLNIVAPEYHLAFSNLHQRVMRGESGTLEFEIVGLKGTRRWLETHAVPLRYGSDQVKALLGVTRDITERKQVQDELRLLNIKLEQRVVERTTELEQANRAKDEFLANMSHELRTPLNTVLGLSETLLEQRKGPLNEKQTQALELISSSGRHLLSLINDILEVSKIEAGKIQLYSTSVSVKELCESSLNFIKEMALKKRIDLEYINEDGISELHADPQRLKQILINLLMNAVKFTPDQGKVSLKVFTNTDKDQILFSITDTGIGIAQDELKKLFTPFTQLDGSLARQYPGTGLGLTLVQKLTDMHGGSVHVESEPGKGSCFTIRLPWRTDTGDPNKHPFQSTEHLTDEGQASPSVEGSHDHDVILLAEDNEANIVTISEYLEAYGYEVFVAHDGLEAIEKAKTINPSLILMDIQMPAMDGLEAMRLLRLDTRFTTTPIIALTALAMPGDRERCISAGANEYMSKPISLKELVKTIARLLEQMKN